MEKQDFQIKWYRRDYNDEYQVAIISDLGDGTFLCQPLFQDKDGNIKTSGNKLVCSSQSLSDKPSALIRYEKEEENLRDKTRILENKLRSAQNDVEKQCNILRKRVKWLKNIEKESHPEAIKEIIRMMYMLVDVEDLYLFIPKVYSASFVLRKFNITEPYAPMWDNDGDFKLLSIYPNSGDIIRHGVNFQLSEYYDGSGVGNDIKLFNSYQKAIEFIKQYINDLPTIKEETISQCEKYGIPIPKDKVMKYLQDKLVDNRAEIGRYEDKLAIAKSKNESLIKEIEMYK